MSEFDNDKNMAILAVTVICCLSMWWLGADAKDIIIPSITGIFGVVTGRVMK